MKKTYKASLTSRKTTPQTEAIPGREQEMVANSAGGVVFAADQWTRLERFLILGSDSPTYYQEAKELTKENAEAVKLCLQSDGIRTVNTIVDISVTGRAPNNEAAIYALALSTSPEFSAHANVRGYAASKLNDVCRIGTHLFSFVTYVNELRGWGRGIKTAVANWYTEKDTRNLGYQLVKYQQREGMSHRDVLRLAHPKADSDIRNLMYRWAVNGKHEEGIHPMIDGWEAAKKATTPAQIVRLIEQYGLTHEMIPTQFKGSLEVWEALLEKMPITALIRNLGKMTNIGLIKSLSAASKTVVGRLSDTEYLRKSRVHPLKMLLAYGTYGMGRGVKGKLVWTPVATVTDALMDGFYGAFANVEPTGLNWLLGIDVSGSMTGSWGGTHLTHCQIAAAQAMVIARTEPNYYMFGFSTHFVNLGITAKDTLETASRKAHMMNFGRTDCAVPMTHATAQKLDVDIFVVITDCETYAGSIQPCQALVGYRRKLNKPNARLAVIATAANRFTIADPKDGGMMDFVGFDANVPVLLSDFALGGRRKSKFEGEDAAEESAAAE